MFKSLLDINIISLRQQFAELNANTSETYGLHIPKSVMELAYYQLDSSGVSKKIDTELYEDINEGYAKLRDLFSGYASVLLNNNDFICELTN